MLVNRFVGPTEFLGVLLNELLADSGHDSAFPDRLRRCPQEEQLASESGELAVEGLDIVPLDHSRAHAMSQVQGVEKHEAPGARVLLHALVQPLQQTADTVKMLQI